MIPTPLTMGIFSTAILLFVLGLNMTPIGNNVSPSFILSTSPYIKIRRNNWRAPFKIQNFARFSLVSLSIHPLSGRGAERIRQGEGRCSRPPKTALERSDLTENCCSENRILRPRRKKLLTEPPQKRMIIGIFIFFALRQYSVDAVPIQIEYPSIKQQ